MALVQLEFARAALGVELRRARATGKPVIRQLFLPHITPSGKIANT